MILNYHHYILVYHCARYLRLINFSVLSKFSSHYPGYIYVHDGPNANAGMITSITGNDLPDDMYSTGSDIFLDFQSDLYHFSYHYLVEILRDMQAPFRVLSLHAPAGALRSYTNHTPQGPIDIWKQQTSAGRVALGP